MIITVTSFKGGVGKTTTAVHLSCYLHEQKKSVLLIDGDPNRSCLAWSRRGLLPFPVVDERAAPKHIGKYDHLVIDTAARPGQEELGALAFWMPSIWRSARISVSNWAMAPSILNSSRPVASAV